MNLVRFYSDGFHVGLLVKEGNTHDHVVAFTRQQVRVLKFPAKDLNALQHVAGDVERARQHFLNLGKTRGITDAAKNLLEISK